MGMVKFGAPVTIEKVGDGKDLKKVPVTVGSPINRDLPKQEPPKPAEPSKPKGS